MAPQPFKVLALLASHYGQLVTREEIRDRIWGLETFVDFEHGLNVAIKEIRITLGDNATAPRYIETLPRRGYRFLAPVVPINSVDLAQPVSADSAAVQQPSISLVSRQSITTPSLSIAESHAENRRNSVRLLAGAGFLLLLVGSILALNLLGLGSRVLKFMAPGPRSYPSKIESIAVLPLENLSQDPDQEYFSDGLTDLLITDLGRIMTMRVISRASVMRYKRGQTPISQIARELNVDAVVEGTVQRSGGNVRISIQLLDAHSDRHLWADTYERNLTDLIQLQRELALAIAHEISGRLSPVREVQLDAARPLNVQAFDDYLHGRYLFSERTAETEMAARGYFEEALRADSRFALAYSGLGDSYSVSWLIPTDFELGEQYARKAITLNPELAEGHASLGIVLTYRHHFAEAEQELKRAIFLNRNYSMAHHWFSINNFFQGHLAEALAENDRARELDPYSLPINFMRGGLLFSLGEHERAAEQYKFASSISPLSASPHVQLARVYWYEDKVRQAVEEEKIVANLEHDSLVLPEIAEVEREYARAGSRAARMLELQVKLKAYHRARQLSTQHLSELYAPYNIATVYALLGQKEKVLEWIRISAQQEATYLPVNLLAPELQSLRADPQFQALVASLNMED